MVVDREPYTEPTTKSGVPFVLASTLGPFVSYISDEFCDAIIPEKPTPET